jgi:hypothetical protein
MSRIDNDSEVTKTLVSSRPGLYISAVGWGQYVKRIKVFLQKSRVRLGVGGEITGWYFKFVRLKMRLYKHFVCCVQI